MFATKIVIYKYVCSANIKEETELSIPTLILFKNIPETKKA